MYNYTSTFLKHLIIYSYIPKTTDIDLIKNIVVFNKSISRQTPYLIINNKNEIIGTKTTLHKHCLKLFLYKLKLFSIPVIKTPLSGYQDIFKLDENHNISLVIKDTKCFFESKTNLLPDFPYTITIHLIFNKNINLIHKSSYINDILNLTL